MSKNKEELYFNSNSKELFLKSANDLLNRCFDFKVGPPVKINHEDGFVLDTTRIQQACQIIDVGEPIGSIIDQFQDAIMDQSLNFGSPTFLAHPDNGVAISAVLGDIARGMIHQNLVSYEYSPAATYVEYELILAIRQLVGYQCSLEDDFDDNDGGAFSKFVFGESDRQSATQTRLSVGKAGGVFVFGGTTANYISLLAARENLKRKLKKQGKIFDARRTRVLTKIPYAHYSLRRGAHMLGIGNSDLSDSQLSELNVAADFRVDVKSNNYHMDTYDLEKKINHTLENDEEILCIFALAGDSRMVSFDNLREITKVAQKYDIWVHADGCEGGQCLFSPTRKQLWDGVEEVNSISLDPHKVLMLPYNLSLILMRDIQDMQLIDINTSLVRLGNSSFGTYTPGMGSKDFASLRLWFFLKHLGWDRLAEEIDRRHDLALQTGVLLKDYDCIRLINTQIEHNAVAMTYCPNSFNPTKNNVKVLNTLNKELHHKINTKTSFYIHMMECKDDNNVVSNNRQNITILRMMFGNPATDLNHVKECLTSINNIGNELYKTYKNKFDF